MSEIPWCHDPIRSSVAVGSPNIDFLNMFDYAQLLIEIVGLQVAAGAVPDILLQLSIDDATFDATPGHYNALQALGGNGILLSTALPLNVTHGCRVIIDWWDQPREAWAKVRGGRTTSNNGARFSTTIFTPNSRRTGLRITNSTGANWSVNNGVYIRQRQP